jgi:hypothetical protein
VTYTPDWKERISPSSPEAEAPRLASEVMVAREGVLVCETGSAGVSFGGVSGSVCKPTGFRGRRSVPLFGTGAMLSESHIML